jgi:hypothetical protein
MKAEINIENKARFIALYTPYGEIWKTSDEGHQLKVATGNICLNLKPLSSISDEDAIEVAKIINRTAFNFLLIERECHICVCFENARVLIYPEFSFTSYSERVIPEGGFGGNGSIGLWVEHESVLFAEHFLRSRNYALPYLGISVEEQIEAGWIKLTEA